MKFWDVKIKTFSWDLFLNFFSDIYPCDLWKCRKTLTSFLGFCCVLIVLLDIKSYFLSFLFFFCRNNNSLLYDIISLFESCTRWIQYNSRRKISNIVYFFFPDSDSNLSLGGFEKSFLKINEKKFCHWISLWNEFIFPILLFFIMKKGFGERCVFFQNSIYFMYKKQETWLIDSLNFFLEPHFFLIRY